MNTTFNAEFTIGSLGKIQFTRESSSLGEFLEVATKSISLLCDYSAKTISECISKGEVYILNNQGARAGKVETLSTATMTPEHIKLFVRCWKAEYTATRKLNELYKKIETNQRYNKPTARLHNSADTWSQKQSDACKPLIPLIEAGLIPENATTICQDELGDLGGYVCDCYHEFWLEHNPEVIK